MTTIIKLTATSTTVNGNKEQKNSKMEKKSLAALIKNRLFN